MSKLLGKCVVAGKLLSRRLTGTDIPLGGVCHYWTLSGLPVPQLYSSPPEVWPGISFYSPKRPNDVLTSLHPTGILINHAQACSWHLGAHGYTEELHQIQNA